VFKKGTLGDLRDQVAALQLVNTWMGDCLRTGKPSWYITGHQGQISLPSLQAN